MADLYGVVDSNNNITKFYVSPDFGAAGSNTKLLSDVTRNKSNEYTLFKTVNGIDGYKYKWVSPNIVEKTDTEIKDSLAWKKLHLDNLIVSTDKQIHDLGEDKVKTLGLRKSEGETLTGDEQADIDDFISEMNTIKNSNFHDAAEAENYSRFKSKLVTAGTQITLKRFPTGWAINDVITIIDKGKNPKEFQVTLTAVNSTNKTIDFADPGHTTNFKRLSSYAFKATG